MSPIWQEIIALGIVALAAGSFGRGMWQMLRGKKTGCGSCSNCASTDADSKQLVTLSIGGKSPNRA